MSPIFSYAAVFFGAYVIGATPFGLLIAKSRGIDIRNQGSGNIGATNVWRCCGRNWGLLCFFCDFWKGGGSVLLATKLFAPQYELPADVGIAAAVGAVCGHVFCPYLKFKGGKGIATAAGALVILAPEIVGIALVVWVVTLAIWRYVSLSSICAALVLPIASVAFRALSTSEQPEPGTPIIVLLSVISALAVIRHKSNVVRLVKGEESKIGSKKKPAEGEPTHESDSPK